MAEVVRIEGLREFQAKLRAADRDLPKQLRIILNDAAVIVVNAAQPMVPHRTGRAAASLKAKSTQREGRVAGGSGRAPYYPWLDFGGSVGRRNSVHRPFLKEGRYIYPALNRNRDAVMNRVRVGIERLITKADLA